ncbi:MAG TPA: ECF transporter S component [Spirochaetia bacterium]|nr:ECF transporter S component [Spirochaetia bacterium]
MNEDKPTLTPVFKIAIAAVLIAVTTIFTRVVQIPIAPTRGYLNLGDVAIYFAAFTFGPFTALLAGGIGTAIADLISPYAYYAPISLVVHGLQGFVAGLIAGRRLRFENQKAGKQGTAGLLLVLASLAGTVVMCGGYLLAQIFMVGFGAAVVELPGNILQNVAGVLCGVALSLAVQKAYPPVRNLHW